MRVLFPHQTDDVMYKKYSYELRTTLFDVNCTMEDILFHCGTFTLRLFKKILPEMRIRISQFHLANI